MNDLQFLAQLTMQYMSTATSAVNISDALDKAEKVVEALIKRHHRHIMNHVSIGGRGFAGKPDRECYYCRIMEIQIEQTNKDRGIRLAEAKSGLVGPDGSGTPS
jgi:NADP-dependent 3-hydroxy acid dehydrogenase YdfG